MTKSPSQAFDHIHSDLSEGGQCTALAILILQQKPPPEIANAREININSEIIKNRRPPY